jgi:hypothetical protein
MKPTLLNRTLASFIFILTCILQNFSQAPGTTCLSAPQLIVNGSCALSVSITDGTLTEPGVTNANVCGSGQTVQNEGWYRFQAAATSATITVDASNRNATLQIFSGACGTVAQIGCANTTTTNGAQIESVTVGGLTVGTFYYVRVGTITAAAMNVNSLCITGPVPPSNDNPCTASALGVTASCSFGTYTNLNATASAGVPAPGCAGYLGGDVWFTVTVPASGTINLNTQAGIMTDGGMAVYTGACGALAGPIACNDNGAGMPLISLVGQTPGATLWIRVWENGNNNNGTFGICATNPFAPVSHGDCANPINVCGNTAYDITPSGPGSVVEYGTCSVSDPCTNPNCCNSGCHNAGELNTTWLLVNIQTSGNLQFSLGAPGGFGCYDWVMWGPYTAATCGNIAANTLPPIACNWNGSCQQFTGMASPLPVGANTLDFEAPIAVLAGQKYMISMSNYSGLTTTVPVNFFGTAGIGCGPLPIVLQDFKCRQSGNRMIIEWITQTEINNSYFSVEHSTDGIYFNEIGVMVGAGNSNAIQHYSLVHKTPNPGMNYYRLKQTDYDGQSEIFQVSGCGFELNQNVCTVNIYNMTGQLMQTVHSADYKSDINSLILPVGMYVVEVTNGADKFHQTYYHGPAGEHWFGND